MSPGYPCCCEGCEIFADDFNREDGTDIGDDWSEEAGNWSISSNTLTSPDSSATAVAQTEAPDGDYVVQTLISCTYSHRPRLIYAHQDASNYWYAQIEGNYVTIYQRAGGADTLKASALVSGINHASTGLRVCVKGTTILVLVLAGGVWKYATQYGVTLAVRSCGVGNGASAGAEFDEFAIQWHSSERDGCPECAACALCDNGTPRERYQVTLSGITADGCLECTALNGSFIVELIGDCQYRYCENIDCDGDEVDDACFLLTMRFRDPIYYVNNVQVTVCIDRNNTCGPSPRCSSPEDGCVAPYPTWEEALSPLDCGMSSQSITRTVSTTEGGCDFTNATCSVTAL